MSDALGFEHRWVPSDGGGATLLALHGTGGDENDLLPLVAAVAPGYNVLSPRGKVSEMGALRFFRRRAEGVFDLEDLVARTDELARFVDAAAKAYGFDATHVTALGYSNGANIAASLMLLHPDVLARAALLRPMKPFEPADVGAEIPSLTGRSALVVAGGHDPIVPASSTEGLVDLLRRAGAAVSTHTSPAGHELVRSDVDLLAGWLSSASGPALGERP